MDAKMKEMICGDKLFRIKEKIPLKVLDDIVREQKRLAKIEDEDERELASLPIRNMIFKKMVDSIEELGGRLIIATPTDEYLENEADLDDFEAAMGLMEDVGKAIEARFDEQKKKVLLSPGSRPLPRSGGGAPPIPTKPNG